MSEHGTYPRFSSSKHRGAYADDVLFVFLTEKVSQAVLLTQNICETTGAEVNCENISDLWHGKRYVTPGCFGGHTVQFISYQVSSGTFNILY